MEGLSEKCCTCTAEGQIEGASQLRKPKPKGGESWSPRKSPKVCPMWQGSWGLVRLMSHARVGDWVLDTQHLDLFLKK